MSNEPIAFVASVGEWGLFSSQPSIPALPDPDSNIRQDLATIYVEGLETALQFFRVNLTSVPDGGQTDHVVVSAYPPFPPEAIADAVGRLLPICAGAALCMIVEDRTGSATAISSSHVPPQTVAAAVAHTKIAGGWDESDPIVVAVNEQPFHVSARFDGADWRLVVRRP